MQLCRFGNCPGLGCTYLSRLFDMPGVQDNKNNMFNQRIITTFAAANQ